MAFPSTFRTDSLVLRRLTPADAPALDRLMTGPDAEPLREAMDWPASLDATDVKRYAERYAARWEHGSCASYLVREDACDRAVGAGFCYHDDGTELGLWLHPDWWGEGYGSELLDGLTTLAVEQDAVPVRAVTSSKNERAGRTLARWAARYGGRELPVAGPERRFVVDSPR